MTRPRTTRSAALAVVLLLGVAVASCDPTAPRYDEATVELDTSDGSEVRLITSRDLTIGITSDGNGALILEEADTTWVEVPFTGRYELTETEEFYVRVLEMENPGATLTMRVLLDGRAFFGREATLAEGGFQYLYQAP